MLPHEQRVLDERRDLDERLGRLTAFFGSPVFAKLEERGQSQLRRQAAVMAEYSAILGERIADFPGQGKS